MYATGLRLNEVAHLKLIDLDRSRKPITVRGGKGKKDWVVMLSPKLEALVDVYLAQYRPATYLFEEAERTEPLQNRTIQLVYSDTVRFAGIQKKGGIHLVIYRFVPPKHRAELLKAIETAFENIALRRPNHDPLILFHPAS